MKRFLRKRQLAERYSCVPRSIERAVFDGRLPPPEYPMGTGSPMWDVAKLDANERIAAMRSGAPDWCQRLFAELAEAVTGADAAQVLAQYRSLIDALPAAEKERMLLDAQDVIAEKTE